MEWTTPQYSKKQVDKAGAHLVERGVERADDEALNIINNWRSSHGLALQTIKMNLLRRARRVDEHCLVAQRLKRLSSIETKLRIKADMKLSQMQDIGGCRAVMRDVAGVASVAEYYKGSTAKNPGRGAEFVKEWNYIEAPKTDGYRGVHLVYKYRSKDSRLQVHNGLRIEIQIRSQLQHAWATAVETVSTFTGQALKSNIGRPDWKRFFALMGSAIARREGCPPVPNTPTEHGALAAELRELSAKLNALTYLEGWPEVVQAAPDQSELYETYLLALDTEENRIKVTGFAKNQRELASLEYLHAERNPQLQAVLVEVDSLTALRSAYPSYFLDTTAFVEALKTAIE